MALIETDIILALISITDRHHNDAVKIIKKVKPLKLSPYTIIELDLLIISGKIEVKMPVFYENLMETLRYYNVEIVKPSPKHLVKGWKLREKYGLTYFDSLHASTAIIENEPLISYDKSYQNIEELRYITPQEALEKYM